MSKMFEAALAYAAQGIPVFPCVAGTKRPATANGFKDATTDEATIRSWWSLDPDANVAFSPHTVGQGIVDLDPPDGIQAWIDFCGAHAGPHPKTWTVRTPRGGFHLYYEGEFPTSVRKVVLGKPIDTRGRGSYALLPPSETPDGTYTVHYDVEPVKAPAFLTERLAQMRVKPTIAADTQADTEAAISAARTYLKTRAPAIEGQGGDMHTFNTAAALKDQGIGEATCASLMADWNEKCEPPWEEHDLLTKIENAYRYTENTLGSKAPAPAAGLLAGLQAPAEPKPIAGPVPFGDVLARQVEPVQEVVPGLIERGIVTFLAGAGGSHKSRTALHWGLAIASGVPIYGRAVEQCKFVYLSYEDHPDEVTRRTQAIYRRLGVSAAPDAVFWDLTAEGKPLAVVDDDGVTETEFGAQARTYLRGIEGHKFVVLDSCYNVLQFVGAAKIDEALVKAGIEFLGRLARDTDTTMVVLWHPSQAGQERGDASGWSVAWHNTPRARLSLGADKDEEGTYILKVEKRNNAPKGDPLRLRWDTGMLNVPAAEARQESDRRLVEGVFAVIQEGDHTGQFLQKAGRIMGWVRTMMEHAAPGRRVTDNLIRDIAANLEREGRVRYVSGKGHELAGYRPVRAGEQTET